LFAYGLLGIVKDTSADAFIPKEHSTLVNKETLPYVKGSVAYTDYLKQMNKSVNEADENMYTLPPSADAAAQYFLLYSMRSAADDFEEILDYDYQKANLRVYINSGEYVDNKVIIEELEHYLVYMGFDYFYGNQDGLYGEFKDQSRTVFGIERTF
jgi:hypothetical protein